MHREGQAHEDDLPTDFASFVAGRTGLSQEHALRSIGQWLLEYEPAVTLTNSRQWYPGEHRRQAFGVRSAHASDTIVQSPQLPVAIMVTAERFAAH